MREVSSTNVIQGHLSLETIGKKLSKEETQFDCFDGSYIQGFRDTRHKDYDKTQWRDPLNRAW